MRIAVAFLVCAAVVLPQLASAQDRSQPAGFHANLHFNGAGIKPEDSGDRENGGGMGLAIGYGFSRTIMVFANVDGTNIEADGSSSDYGLGHADLGVRYTFANEANKLVPFLQGALTGRALVSEDFLNGEDLVVSGGALSIGGGAKYHFSRAWAFEGSLLLSGGRFTKARLGDEETDLQDEFSASSSRLNLGISFNPKK